jgi:hypothetical protein
MRCIVKCALGHTQINDMLAEYYHCFPPAFLSCLIYWNCTVPNIYPYLFDHVDYSVRLGCSPPQLLSQFSLQSRVQGEQF